MQVHYLEIVTNDVDAVCAMYSKVYGITSWSAPNPHLGNAVTAPLETHGGTIGVRAPMHDQETPVIRPYGLVPDVVEAVKAATTEPGATVAVPPLQLGGGHGTCAIVIQAGVEYGFWQL
jgi:uncharacterized protein